MIICITGLPGSGKSTAAKLITGFLKKKGVATRHYTTDWVRSRLWEDKKEQIGRDFTADELERSYNGLFMLIDETIRINPDIYIVTDGTFREESQRSRLAEIARKNKTTFLIIKMLSERNISLARMKERLGQDYAEAVCHYDAVKYEEPKGKNTVVVENNKGLNDLNINLEKIINKIWKK